MFSEAPSSRFTPPVPDASANERRSSPPIPADKRSRSSLAQTAAEAPPFHYPPEWEGVVWFADPAPGRSGPVILAEVVGRAALIAGAALVAATVLSVAMGVGADAAVLAGVAR